MHSDFSQRQLYGVFSDLNYAHRMLLLYDVPLRALQAMLDFNMQKGTSGQLETNPLEKLDSAPGNMADKPAGQEPDKRV